MLFLATLLSTSVRPCQQPQVITSFLAAVRSNLAEPEALRETELVSQNKQGTCTRYVATRIHYRDDACCPHEPRAVGSLAPHEMQIQCDAD